MTISHLKQWLHLSSWCDLAHPAVWSYLLDVKILGSHLGLTEIQSQTAHFEVSNLSCASINLSAVMILPAATFTYHVYHWHSSWWRNWREKSGLLRCLLTLSCTPVHRSTQAALCTWGKNYEEHCTIVQHYWKKTTGNLFPLHGNPNDNRKLCMHCSVNNIHLYPSYAEKKHPTYEYAGHNRHCWIGAKLVAPTHLVAVM